MGNTTSQSQYRANLAQQRHSYYGPGWGPSANHPTAPHLSNHRNTRASGFGSYGVPPPHLRRHS